MDVVESLQIPEAYIRIDFPDDVGKVIPEEVMDFHLGLGLLASVAVLHRLVLSIELAFSPDTGSESSIYRVRGTSA